MADRKAPSPEDFARAKQNQKEASKNMEQIRQAVKSQGSQLGVKECFAIYSERTSTAYTYIFLPSDQAIASLSDTDRNDLKLVVDTLFKQFRPDIDNIEVELDSVENVVKNYNGNYFDRLR